MRILFHRLNILNGQKEKEKALPEPHSTTRTILVIARTGHRIEAPIGARDKPITSLGMVLTYLPAASIPFLPSAAVITGLGVHPS